MGILSWIILGLIAGVLAKFAMPGNDPGGWIVTILLGIAGAFTAGFLGNALGLGIPTGELSVMGVLAAAGGSFVLLAVYRLLR